LALVIPTAFAQRLQQLQPDAVKGNGCAVSSPAPGSEP